MLLLAEPLPSPEGEAWGRTPPPRPPAYSPPRPLKGELGGKLPPATPGPLLCKGQLLVPTRSGGGGRGFAGSPCLASPAFAPEAMLLLAEPLPSPKGGGRGTTRPLRPLTLPPVKAGFHPYLSDSSSSKADAELLGQGLKIKLTAEQDALLPAKP
jgi:hypothetical protein